MTDTPILGYNNINNNNKEHTIPIKYVHTFGAWPPVTYNYNMLPTHLWCLVPNNNFKKLKFKN